MDMKANSTMLAVMHKSFFIAVATALLVTTAQAQERQWSLDATDRQAFLLFGVPDTDDVGLSFWCEIGSKRMAAYMPESFSPLKIGEKTTMTLTIDGAVFNLAATAARDQASNRMTVEAPFKRDNKLISKLKDAQTVAVSVKGHHATYPLADADVQGLLDTCSGIDQGN